VAILSNPDNAYHRLAIREVNVAARSLGVQLQLLEARGPNEFAGACAAMAKDRVGGALLVLSDSIFGFHRTRLADLAARRPLPAAYGARESVEAGFLMSYGPSFLDPYRRAATYVDQILKGAKPAELPVDQPTKFELVINMKTAKAHDAKRNAAAAKRPVGPTASDRHERQLVYSLEVTPIAGEQDAAVNQHDACNQAVAHADVGTVGDEHLPGAGRAICGGFVKGQTGES